MPRTRRSAPAQSVEFVELEFPFDPAEEIDASRTDDDGVLWFTTTLGRKVGISPDGWCSVVSGPDIDAVMPLVPKPPRKSWKDPR